MVVVGHWVETQFVLDPVMLVGIDNLSEVRSFCRWLFSTQMTTSEDQQGHCRGNVQEGGCSRVRAKVARCVEGGSRRNYMGQGYHSKRGSACRKQQWKWKWQWRSCRRRRRVWRFGGFRGGDGSDLNALNKL